MRFDAPLFEPGFGPGMPFRFNTVVGGASELAVVVVPLASGVALESEGFSEGDGSTTWATGVDIDEDDALDRGWDCFRTGSIAEGNLESTAGDSCSVMIFDLGCLAGILVVVAVGVVEVRVLDDDIARWRVMKEEGERR